MLVIRLQRTGRSGHAMFRMVVQDSRRTPTSGNVIAQVGSYDPHLKTINLDKDKIKHFLDGGAQPSDRVISLLISNKIDLPKWVKQPTKKERNVKNPDKRRSTAPEKPAEETAEVVNEVATEETPNSEVVEEQAEENTSSNEKAANEAAEDADASSETTEEAK